MGVFRVSRLEGDDSEVGNIGVGTTSKTRARIAVLTFEAGSSKDRGDSQKGGDHELSVEEHCECERWKIRDENKRQGERW